MNVRYLSGKRRGAVAVLVVISLVLVLGMAALAIDVGYIYNRRTEMQNAVDAGALAGATGLHYSNSEARARAIASAGSNYLGPEAVAVHSGDVQVGNWHWQSKSFTPIDESVESERRPNAVRVVGQKSGLRLFFATILGANTTGVQKEAVAMEDAGRCRGVWGLEGVTMTGNIITDSYDSREGGYGPGNIKQNGDICSNQDIRVNGGIEIHGDAMYGPDYDMTINGGSNEIWGTVAQTCCAVDPPVVDPSVAKLHNDNNLIRFADDGGHAVVGGNLHLVEDDNLTVPPGTYYLKSARVVGQATITITGPTVIYVDGDASFGGGGIINVTQDPKNLIIYCTGNNLHLNGGGGFFGALVAPNTDVTLGGNSSYYGTVIGKTITGHGDMLLHVDESVVADLMGGAIQQSPVLVK